MAAKKAKREIAPVVLRDPNDTSPMSFSEQIAQNSAGLKKDVKKRRAPSPKKDENANAFAVQMKKPKQRGPLNK